MKSCDATIQMKPTEQYFPVVLYVMLCKVVLIFASAVEILWRVPIDNTLLYEICFEVN